jgi:hypothetical protein
MSTKITHKIMKLPKGSSILLNGESHWAIRSRKDIYFDSVDEGSMLSLEYENLIRYQYRTPQLYDGVLIHSIDFSLDDLVEVE